MRGKGFAVSVLAAVGVLALSSASRGGDTIRLNLVDNAPAKNLVDDGQGAATVQTWYRGWGYRGFGWGGWGYRGLGWGGFYRPYWGWGGYYRPYWGWGGLYRPYYGLGFYRPYYGFGLGYGLGFGGFGYGLGYGGLGYGGFFGPCSGVTASVYTLNLPAVSLGTPLPGSGSISPGSVPAPQLNDDGTFPYDGGPQQVVPNPKDTPSSTTPRSVPLEGRTVSLPRAEAKWTYPAYGETARRATPTSEPTYLTRGEAKKANSR